VKIFNDKTVVFLGRLGSMPQKLAKQEVERRGGRTQRSISPDTDFVVVGHFAYRLLDGGRLQWKLDQADAASARCISENQFLALSELREIDEPEKTLSVESLAAQAGLDATIVAQIVLFDVIEPNEGWCSFRDVVAAKEAARLIGQGASIAEIVAGNLALQRNPNEQPQNLAQVHLTRSEPDGLVMKIGEKLAELDGQIVASLLTVPEWSDWRNATVCWVHSVYVEPGARRKGVFSTMYRHLRERVEASADLAGLRLYTEHNNHTAKSVYESLGMSRERYLLYEWLAGETD